MGSGLMAKDAAIYKAFIDHFSIEILHRVPTPYLANKKEKDTIQGMGTMHPGGYNCLRGATKEDRRWWYFKK